MVIIIRWYRHVWRGWIKSCILCTKGLYHHPDSSVYRQSVGHHIKLSCVRYGPLVTTYLFQFLIELKCMQCIRVSPFIISLNIFNFTFLAKVLLRRSCKQIPYIEASTWCVGWKYFFVLFFFLFLSTIKSISKDWCDDIEKFFLQLHIRK